MNPERRGLWTEPKRSGDTVRILTLKRGGYHGRPLELGDVRIHQYRTFIKVCSSLPGVEACSPWRYEKHETFRPNQSDLADSTFDRYVDEAYADGWGNYYPEQHGAQRG